MFAINIENLKKNKQTKNIYLKITLSLSIVYSKCGHEQENVFKEEGSIVILKTLGFINNIEVYQEIYSHV